MSGRVESISSVTTEWPDKKLIPHNNKRKKTSDTLIKGKKSIQEPDNLSKIAKKDSVPDVEIIIIKTPPTNENKEDCIDDTNEKTHCSNYSPIETDGERNLGEEHENE